MKLGITLIVNTCNQAEYLDRVLNAVSCPDRSHHRANQERLERTMQGNEIRCLRGIDFHETAEEDRIRHEVGF